MQQKKDIPLSLAMLVLLAVACGYAYLTYFRFEPAKLNHLRVWAELHRALLWVSLIGFTANLTLLGIMLKRVIGLERQGSRLEALEGKRGKFRFGRNEMFSALVGIGSYFCASAVVKDATASRLISFLGHRALEWLGSGLCWNIAIFCGLTASLLFSLLGKLRIPALWKPRLKMPEVGVGDLVLGTTSGEIGHSDQENNENWVKIPSRGLSGGIFVSGSPGSGKTQGTILRYLDQIAENPELTPSMILIDPKRTFLDEAERMLRKSGHGDRIVKISLNGNMSFNPVYVQAPLRDSRYTGLAEMVRAAAVNFIGKSSDSPFWDITSANLIKNAIAYCAAKHGYFTLLELYRTIVRASKDDLASDLKECLRNNDWRYDERFNIERAIEYFESEYSQLEDRVRTGIMATSTAFINQFQEYAASRIFCPRKENISIESMEDLVRERKIILFDVNQPGLGRSMGTFVKLHYQQAVLNLLPELKREDLPCTTSLIIDEYQDVVTSGGGGTLGDESFLAKVRESKPAVIVATQSLISVMNALGHQKSALELMQNFRTRIACHSSDIETIKLFQELAGKEDVEHQTRSLSETAQSAKRNLLVGGFDSENASINESVSRGVRREDLVTGKEFSRLRTFEAFAQVFDGIETRFLKLYLKPHFLRSINTAHETVLEILKGTKQSVMVEKLKRMWINTRAVLASLFLAGPVQSATIPNVCTIAKSPAFTSCLELNIGGCTCGFPPHPCAAISYYVPESFIEVWPRTSYFAMIPGVGLQLSEIFPGLYGAEGDWDTQSFHSHAIAVPLAATTFRVMPGANLRTEKMCFDGMSEHFGKHWNTGKGDLLQPTFLAWSAAPKACLLKGAVTSATGDGEKGVSMGSGLCSFQSPLETFPPSSHSVCNGWGVFFPRYGTYAGPASMTGALMIASRLKSLSVEVLKTMPASPDEKWQMIYPQSSSCFREGQNVGALETVMNVREVGRLTSGKMKGYLFAIWKKEWTCMEFPAAVQAQAAALAIPAACRGMQ